MTVAVEVPLLPKRRLTKARKDPGEESFTKGQRTKVKASRASKTATAASKAEKPLTALPISMTGRMFLSE